MNNKIKYFRRYGTFLWMKYYFKNYNRNKKSVFTCFVGIMNRYIETMKERAMLQKFRTRVTVNASFLSFVSNILVSWKEQPCVA